MNVASSKIVSVGEITQWGRQFLGALQTAQLAEVTFEPNFQKFCEAAGNQFQIVFMEATPESRQQIAKLRQLGRRLYLAWFGRNFTKEDVAFALENRVFCIFENYRPDDKRVVDAIKKISTSLENTEQFEQLIRSVKGVLVQAEAEMPRPLLAEIKTAIGKLERFGLQNEFNGVSADLAAGPDTKLPFHRAQDFGDALSTVHNLERTGVLWVRGRLPTEEGKVEFLQGKIVAANSGEVRGVKAIYRMFLWDDPKFLFTRKDPRESTVGDSLNMSMKYLCHEGQDLKKRYEAIRRELPPLDLSLELEPSSLHAGTNLELNEFSTLASVVEFNKVHQVLDYNNLPDVYLYEALIRLRRNKIIRVV